MRLNGRDVSVRTRVALSIAVMASLGAAAVELIARQAAVSPAVQNARVTQQDISRTCGSCHDVPPADILPRAAWRRSFEQMAIIRTGERQTAEMRPPGSAAMLGWASNRGVAATAWTGPQRVPSKRRR